ncbi:MAG: ABC transporter ATP-binding protein [Anaerolineae bacterium]|nr:ABC transporter ATP-binding protein [Anaerolineae bacterium]
MSDEVLLELRDVRKWFPVGQSVFDTFMGREPDNVRAVDGVSFGVPHGKVYGLAGESGSGKSTTGRLAVRLLEPTSGQVLFDGNDITMLSKEDMRSHRREMQVIFQDPFASLNPRMTLGEGIAHGLRIHNLTGSRAETRERVMDIMHRVGLTPPGTFYNRYPHQISGGQRQRVVIARALVLQPKFIVADEPIAMTDASVRAVLLDLMIQLKEDFDLTYLFITHDLATAKYICDTIAIMYLGRIVESGPLTQVYTNPQHPYTEALLAAVPVPDPRHRRDKPMPHGEIPNSINPPPGCAFHPRCPKAMDICRVQSPPLEQLDQASQVPPDQGHYTACWLYSDPEG